MHILSIALHVNIIEKLLKRRFMRKEFEINGCIEVQAEITEDEFSNAFIQFVESKGWSFGGGINEIQDGYYILPDGSKGKSVLEDE
ncbi:hypothetical protein HMPREF9099_01425 [Lachnospiraceae bacterium oral taxon 082 str. F0431]|jgi:hypothetical protein|nr:hypothetical protein HMPREF9099_01425 [Lachnospiraceae bacterium oral taxon 082 str. F0431]